MINIQSISADDGNFIVVLMINMNRSLTGCAMTYLHTQPAILHSKPKNSGPVIKSIYSRKNLIKISITGRGYILETRKPLTMSIKIAVFYNIGKREYFSI